MKRIGNFIGILLIGSLIAGCGKVTATEEQPTEPSTPMSSPTPVPPTSTPMPEITIEATALNGVQLHFLHPWSGDLQVEIDRMIDEFNQTNEWKIFVIADAAGSAGEVSSALQKRNSAEKPADLVAVPIDELLKLNRNQKSVVDLNPYLYSQKWGMTQQQISDFVPVFWEQDEVNGYRYGIPAERTAAVLFYNQTWAKELGFSNPPATPEEFHQQICAANQWMKKDNDTSNDGLGGWIVSTDDLTALSWLKTFNTPIYQNGTYQFNSPAASDTLTFLLQQLTDGCAWISRVPTSYAYFSSRRALIYSGYLQDILPQLQSITAAGSSDQWEIIPYPAVKTASVIAEGPSFAVLASTPEKQLASWLFIRWLSSPEHQARIVSRSSTLPLSASVQPLLTNFAQSVPQWNAVYALQPDLQTPPVDPNWSYAGTVLEDAFWQLFKSGMKKDQIPALLEQMDSTLQELIEQQP